MKDLFGNEVEENSLPTPPAVKKKRDESPKWYAARPGSGPNGFTCGDCRYACRRSGGSRYFWKCWLLRERWTGSYGTDIRLKSPACRFFEVKI